jgi:hypothetical protein
MWYDGEDTLPDGGARDDDSGVMEDNKLQGGGSSHESKLDSYV